MSEFEPLTAIFEKRIFAHFIKEAELSPADIMKGSIPSPAVVPCDFLIEIITLLVIIFN
jgi:hypothetical protein